MNGPSHNQVIGNLISGNSGNGVSFCCTSDTSYNTVSGNYIGTDASGMRFLPNGSGGVHMDGGTRSNVVGGDNPGERNIISGNSGSGVSIGDDATGNVVIGNYIGTGATGMYALGNGLSGDGPGVSLYGGAHHNRIGGGSAAERNLISGNHSVGVAIMHSGTEYNVVAGNYIGTDATGIGPLANYIATDAASATAPDNTWSGLSVRDGASHNLIGGSRVTDGNVIAYNGVYGVHVRGGDTVGNTLSHNSIHSNLYKGIELTDGGNRELPAPVIVTVTVNLAGNSTVAGRACAGCTVEVFTDDEDEGRVFRGSVTTNAGGQFTFTGTLSGACVTATATDAEGNTSELTQRPSCCHVPTCPSSSRAADG
jgi:titin